MLTHRKQLPARTKPRSNHPGRTLRPSVQHQLAGTLQPSTMPTTGKRNCSCGGHCPACSKPVSRYTIGAPKDSTERAADQTAGRVLAKMNVEHSPQRRQISAGQITAPPQFDSSLANLKQSGKPLPENIRSPIERTMGTDFSDVRIHTDQHAAAMASSIQSRAFTSGRHIVFNRNQYAPDKPAGQWLLAHELAHTRQGSSEHIIRREPSFIDETIEDLKKEQPLLNDTDANFCTAYPDPAAADVLALQQWYLKDFNAIQQFLFGEDVAYLWRAYYSGSGGPMYFDQYSDMAQRFNKAKIIIDRQKKLLEWVELSLRGEWSRGNCPALPPGVAVKFPVAKFLPEADLKYPINFSNPYDVPGHVAGGVEPGGRDTRELKGEFSLTRQTGADGKTSGITLTPAWWLEVRDVIDFCPGDIGSTREKTFTIPLSRLEKSGLAVDVPFQVDATGPAMTRELSEKTIKLCYPDYEAAPTPTQEDPSTKPPPEPDSSDDRER